jgi:hypothetical protein
MNNALDNGGGRMSPGVVVVKTTSGVGFSPEHWADRALNKIVQVSGESDSPIRQQAEAFKESVRLVLIYYIKQAIKSDRTTLFNEFNNQNHADMAEILRTL